MLKDRIGEQAHEVGGLAITDLVAEREHVGIVKPQRVLQEADVAILGFRFFGVVAALDAVDELWRFFLSSRMRPACVERNNPNVVDI